MAQTQIMDDAEYQQFAEFKRQQSRQAAEAQVAKLEYNLVGATVDKNTLKKACQEANTLKLGAICVLPNAVRLCAKFLGAQPQTSLIACISYPHGGDTFKIKCKAIKEAVKDGVDEVEVTAPIACIKDGDWGAVKHELRQLKKATKKKCALRINIESELLTMPELTKLCTLIADYGIPSVRVASDIYGTVFKADIISAIKNVVKDKCTIKASGITSYSEVDTAINMGASIVGSKNAPELARLILNVAD